MPCPAKAASPKTVCLIQSSPLPGFALEALDIPGFGFRIFSEDLPIVLCDPLHFEGDSGFAHTIDYAPSGLGRKPKSGLPYSN
jgi:hypothetical protein